MGKIVKAIKGERFPKIGEKLIFKLVLEKGVNFEDILDSEVKWQLYQANEYSEYEVVSFSGQKIGKEVPYTFLTPLLNRHMKLIVSYKNESTEMLVIPTQGDAKIVDVFFLDNTGKQLEKIPSYGESIILRIYTVNLKEKNLNFTIYDTVDEKEVEVGKNSKPLKVIQNNGVVKSDLITLNSGMSIKTKQDMSIEVHKYRVKVVDEAQTLSYEEELKVKNLKVNVSIIPPDVLAPTKVVTAPKKEKEKKKDEKKKCFCNRDLTVEEVKSFYGSKILFSAKNCPLPKNKKTYEEFVKALNTAMNKYDINTCLRKAHFLAQIEVESDRLNTTLEYADGWDYDHTTHQGNYDKYKLYLSDKDKYKKYNDAKIKRGYNRYIECLSHGHNVKGYGPKYKGKGLIQLTWKNTYEKYFKYLNKPELINTPNIVANDLTYSCDSASWYWRYQSKWKNLNIAADRDDVYYINIGVNGGFRHFDSRIKNVKSILKLMKIKENCLNIKDLKKELGKYTYATSNIKDYKYGKVNKGKFEKYDDK